MHGEGQIEVASDGKFVEKGVIRAAVKLLLEAPLRELRTSFKDNTRLVILVDALDEGLSVAQANILFEGSDEVTKSSNGSHEVAKSSKGFIR